MVEPLGNSVQVPYTPCYHCVDEVREGSVQSNHSELTSKTSSGWFKPRQTFPNHIIPEIAKCVEFCHMSSGWFD